MTNATADDSTTLAALVPDDLRDCQTAAMGRIKDADLWVTDLPVCLCCGAVNPAAYGGARESIVVDGHELVGETCHNCEQKTVQVLRSGLDGDDADD